MRNFFRFLFKDEKIETNLALGIPRFALKYARHISYHLTPDQVRAAPTVEINGFPI